MAPKVFLSSTIQDLADLRSAVRYYLEEHGFEVYASESADFPHGLDHDARVAALAPLDDADVYVLLLGFRYGSQTSDGVSATRLEFRRARDLHRHGGRPKSVLLVRRDVLRLIKAGVESSDESDDWAALRSFVAEVGNEGEDASPNWINEFSSFRDVASVLSATLRLTGSLRRLALEANLTEELLANSERLLVRLRGAVGARSRLLRTLDGKLTGRRGHVVLSAAERGDLVVGRLLLPPAGAFATAALEDAIGSGEFLEWDWAAAQWNVGPEQRALIALRDRVGRYDLLASMLVQRMYVAEYSTITRTTGHSTPVSEEFLSVLLGVRDQLANVEMQVALLLVHLLPPGLPIVEIAPLPPSPLPGEAERIAADTVTRDDVVAWIGAFTQAGSGAAG